MGAHVHVREKDLLRHGLWRECRPRGPDLGSNLIPNPCLRQATSPSEPTPAIGLQSLHLGLGLSDGCVQTLELRDTQSAVAVLVSTPETTADLSGECPLVSAFFRLGPARPPHNSMLPGVPAGPSWLWSVFVSGCGGSTEGLCGLWPCLQALAAPRPATSRPAVVCRPDQGSGV